MASSEFELIRRAFCDKAPSAKPSTRIPSGDDASVHAIDGGMELVISTDTSLAGVHWPNDFPLDMAADRSVSAGLSDLAAMGAEACWAWTAVMAASSEDAGLIGAGVTSAVARYNIELAGGDLVASSVNGLCITVAGQLPAGAAMRRNGAKPDDDIWLAGRVGFAALGLQQWMHGEHDGEFVPGFSVVEPKLDTGIRLRELGVGCCIDISDGLLQDADHIASSSGVGMRLEMDALPGWETLCAVLGESAAMDAALAGGEDYALLFTAPRDLAGLEEMATRIGACHAGSGVCPRLHGKQVCAQRQGYDHFA